MKNQNKASQGKKIAEAAMMMSKALMKKKMTKDMKKMGGKSAC